MLLRCQIAATTYARTFHLAEQKVADGSLVKDAEIVDTEFGHGAPAHRLRPPAHRRIRVETEEQCGDGGGP